MPIRRMRDTRQSTSVRRHPRVDGRARLTTRELIAGLLDEFPDGWALSCKTNSLRSLLPLCPEKVRVAAWSKSSIPAYRGIRPIYSWEPVILVGGRIDDRMVKDSLVASNRQGLKPRKTTAPLGGKPPIFCRWILDMLGYVEGDELVDIFPGTGVMSRVVAQGVLL